MRQGIRAGVQYRAVIAVGVHLYCDHDRRDGNAKGHPEVTGRRDMLVAIATLLYPLAHVIKPAPGIVCAAV